MTRFLAMPVCNVATAQILFDALAHELQSRDIPWSNMIGFASNTASVMVGARNSVLSRLQSEQPKLFSEIKPLRVLKHCTTRWLSLQRCIKRLLEQWPALFAYFDRQIDIVLQMTGCSGLHLSSRIQKSSSSAILWHIQ